jgi:hypothetical protein
LTAALWRLTPHVCGACFGRVLRSEPGLDGRWRFRCADCGVESDLGNDRSPPLCACRIKFANRNAGIRCAENPNPRPEMPAEFIAIDKGEQ